MDAEVDVTESFSKLRGALKVALEMRRAQKTYFKSRKQDDLIAARRLEAALDMRLAELEIK